MTEKIECTIADVLMDIHENECLFLKTDIMEIVDPFDYIKKYLPKNPTEEDYKLLLELCKAVAKAQSEEVITIDPKTKKEVVNA